MTKEQQAPQQQQQQQQRHSIELSDVTVHNIGLLKKLNTVVFPVTYQDKFYNDAVKLGEFAKLAFFNDIMVGAVCARIEPDTKRLYIMTLGCLAPYRHLGIGSTLLNHILAEAKKNAGIESVYLHVQISNDVAVEFYKKFGFAITETVQGYYKRVEPADAYILSKKLN